MKVKAKQIRNFVVLLCTVLFIYLFFLIEKSGSEWLTNIMRKEEGILLRWVRVWKRINMGTKYKEMIVEEWQSEEKGE